MLSVSTMRSGTRPGWAEGSARECSGRSCGMSSDRSIRIRLPTSPRPTTATARRCGSSTSSGSCKDCGSTSHSPTAASTRSSDAAWTWGPSWGLPSGSCGRPDEKPGQFGVLTSRRSSHLAMKGTEVARTKPLDLIVDTAVDAVVHPFGTVGKAVEQVRGTVGLSWLVAEQLTKTALTVAWETASAAVDLTRGSSPADVVSPTPDTTRLRSVPPVNEPAYTSSSESGDSLSNGSPRPADFAPVESVPVDGAVADAPARRSDRNGSADRPNARARGAAKKSATNKSTEKKSSSAKKSAERPATKKSSAKKSAERPATKKSTAKKSSERPATKKSTAKKSSE